MRFLACCAALGYRWTRRGSIVTSRLASYYRERFAGFAFLSGGYYPSLAGFQIKDAIEHNVKNFKAELFGYWLWVPGSIGCCG